jgi:uncharacterized alpha/beta hydrolase family protein/uncharacterized protein YukE
MSDLEGQSYPIRLLASQFSKQSEEMRQAANQYKSQAEQLTVGGEGWTGQGAQGYLAQADVLVEKMQRAVHAFQLTSSALYQLADRVDAIHAMKNRLAHLKHQYQIEMQAEAYHQGGIVNMHHDLFVQIHHLEQEIEHTSAQYNKDSARQFQEIARMAPAAGSLLEEMKQATVLYGPFLTPAVVPILVHPRPGDLKGRGRVEYLNEVIMMNRVVHDYYETHPGATGPNGESAEEMCALALAAQNEARTEGGTFGVPIVFMHGLEGDLTTFQKMVDSQGGFSKIYTFTKDGRIVVEDGPNRDADQPLVQYVFEDGAMKFDRQSAAFGKMTEQMKKELSSDYLMVASHSMGGVITTQYIEDSGGDDILRFVTLGSPILGSDIDSTAHKVLNVHKWLTLTNPVSQLIHGALDYVESRFPAVADLQKGSKDNREIWEKRGSFNPNIEVFSGAGRGLGPLGDGVVMPDSAFGLRYFANPAKFHSKTYEGDNHSQLHDRPEELEDTMNFLRYGEVPHAK